MKTIFVVCLIGGFIAGNSVSQTPSYRTESRDDEQQADIVEASQGEEARFASELKLLRKQFESIQEGLSQLKNDYIPKSAFAANMQSGFYGPPYHLHHYYHQARPAPYRSDSAPDSDELSALRQLLEASEIKQQATEYKLQATEYRLERTEAKLQALEDRLGVEQDSPQATEGRSGSCEDKLLVTQQRLKSAETKLQLLYQTSSSNVSSDGIPGHGSTFIRWGRTQCPNDTQVVYSGVAGGYHFTNKGAAGNRLCLTMDPQYDNTPGTGHAYLSGVEYEIMPEHHNHDVPCSVCMAPQSNTIMMPATFTCPSGWITQYTGHLVAGYHGHEAASEYLCLDGEPEHRVGGHDDKNGALFYLVQTACNSLPCPPYVHDKVVTCAVCSI